MIQCLNRFILPLFLFYLGFLVLGSLVGLAIGLFIGAVLISIIIGFFIGLAVAVIVNAIVLILINKICYTIDPHHCN